MLAAQGYQESQLNQNAKSHVGAIGVMLIMPVTCSQLGACDIHVTEPNIHVDAKYMDHLMTNLRRREDRHETTTYVHNIHEYYVTYRLTPKEKGQADAWPAT